MEDHYRSHALVKVAIVTGASKGIGAGIAKAFGAEGAAVVVNYARDHEQGKIAISAVRPAARRQPSKVAVFVDFLAELLAKECD